MFKEQIFNISSEGVLKNRYLAYHLTKVSLYPPQLIIIFLYIKKNMLTASVDVSNDNRKVVECSYLIGTSLGLCQVKKP